MKRKWIAAVAATCFALGWLVGGGYRVEAQAATDDRYMMQEWGSTTFMINTRTGDAWKWYMTDDEGMGWQYFALPKRIDGCTSSDPACLP